MLRNKDIPQGVKANRLGYPARMIGGPYVYGNERSSLLRSYSDEQLTKVNKKLKQSDRRLNVIKWASPFVETLGVGASLFSYMAVIEQARGLIIPAESIVAPLVNGFNLFSQLIEHVGIGRNIYSDGFAALAISFITPLIVASTADILSYAKRSQSTAIEKEQSRRETEKAIAAALAAQKAQEAAQAPQTQTIA